MPGTTPNSSSTKRNLVSATPLPSSKRIRLNDNAELGLSIDIDEKPVLPRCNNVRSRSLMKQVESRGTTSTFKLPDLNATPKSPTTRQLYKDVLQEKIISPTEIDVSFDDFPYYLSDATKNSLISSTFIRLKYSNVNSEVPDFNSIGPKMLLSGPAGSETYQEMLVKALAKHFGVRLLIVDSRWKTDAYIVGPLIFEEEDEVHKNRFLKYAPDVSSEIACSESKNGPLIVYFKSADKDVLNAACRESKFKLSKFPRNAVVIASSIRKNQVENLFGAGKCKALEVMLTNMGVLIPNRGTESQANPEPKDKINMLFKHEISIELPQDHTTLAILKRQLERDVGMVKAKVNINKIRSVLYKKHMNSSKDLETLCISDETLASESVDKIGGWALSHYLMNDREAEKGGVVISAENIKYGLNLLQSFRKGTKSLRNSLKDVVTENDFEKKLLADVIASDDIGVSFGDIGSLEKVKDTLTELVMLPLQRPELFSKGQLAKPCKGILLFGPPGTGKTMLAKAVATEVGANFINVSMSSLTSKWFGEAEKIVKAVFTLASKIAPTIIFIDEVDSMLGRRGSSGEHETMRKMKNEFMMNWDGLRTKDNERVVVLAATNRPFDLDEAVIRRFPRRLMVNLPDSKNREKILRVLLGKEEMASDVDLGFVAKMTEGFSGSDLKNLCIVAAHCPLRELLEQEKKGRSLALAEKKALPALQGSADIRALNMEDFKFAHGQVCASCESSSTNELVEWNNLFGEGGSRKKEQLSYYM